MVEELPQGPVPDRLTGVRRRSGQDPGKGVRRPVQRGGLVLLQRTQLLQTGDGLPVEVRTEPGGLPVSRAEEETQQPGGQAPEKAPVDHAVPQLPVGEDDARIRRCVQLRPGGTHPLAPDGAGHTPAPLQRHRSLRPGQNHGQKGEVIAEEQPGQEAIPPAQGVAEPTVDALIGVQLPDLQLPPQGDHIAEHQISLRATMRN